MAPHQGDIRCCKKNGGEAAKKIFTKKYFYVSTWKDYYKGNINLFFMEDNMKKVLMFMLSALAVFSFVGCADDSSNADGGGLSHQ